MTTKKSGTKYNTNLASEFYVLSTLARLGIDASLSLGNKKKVDIAVMREDGTYLTIDVKGIAGTDDWIIGDSEIDFAPNHYYALVSYKKKISETTIAPMTWILSALELKKHNLIKLSSNGKTKYISHTRIRDNFEDNLNKWKVFEG